MKRVLCLLLLSSVVFLTTAATPKHTAPAPSCHHEKQSTAPATHGDHHAKPTIAKPVFSPSAMISEFLRVQVLVPGYGERIKSWDSFDYKAKARAMKHAPFLLAHGPTLPPIGCFCTNHPACDTQTCGCTGTACDNM